MEKVELVAGAIDITATKNSVVIIKAYHYASDDAQGLLRLADSMDLGVRHELIDMCAKEYPWKRRD